MVGNTLCQYKAKRDDAPQIFGFDFHVSAAIPRLHRGPLKPAGSTRKFDISPSPLCKAGTRGPPLDGVVKSPQLGGKPDDIASVGIRTSQAAHLASATLKVEMR